MHFDRNDVLANSDSLSRRDPIQIDRSDLQSKFRVLIVDDDDLVRARLTMLLDASGYAVEQTASGQDALRILNKVPCHLVLTDWQMPDMDGITLCRQLRRSNTPNYMYIVMFTIRNSTQDLLDGFAAGVDEYIVKGTPTEELLTRLGAGRRILRSLPVDASFPQDAQTPALAEQHATLQNQSGRRNVHPQGRRLALLSCDIHEIKEIAGRFGPKAGEYLLREFASRVQRCTRKATDHLEQVSDDTFMLVLQETSNTGAEHVAAKLRQSFAAEPLSTFIGSFSVTAHVDVTARPPKLLAKGISVARTEH